MQWNQKKVFQTSFLFHAARDIVSLIPVVFRIEYALQILFEREKIHIPDTMELVERLRLIDQISIERSIVYKDLHAYEKQHLTERQNMYNELESTNGKIWKLKESYLR